MSTAEQLARIQAEAAQMAARHQHRLGQWLRVNAAESTATCGRCGQYAYVNVHPRASEGESTFSGPALVHDCTVVPSAVTSEIS